MAEVTEYMALRLMDITEPQALTAHEQQQLAYAWLCRRMLREMIDNGEQQEVVNCLEQPEYMARVFRNWYRRST